jgi:hypothetical protein
VLQTARNPRYWVPMLVLIAVIGISPLLAGGGSSDASGGPSKPAPTAAPPTRVATAAPTSTPEPDLDDVLIDSRRALDLAKLADALELYRQRYRVYPGTGGEVVTVCASQGNAGCALTSVATQSLSFNDGEGNAYWYASDGSTYFVLASRVEIARDESACPADLPAELAGGSVLCVRNGGN